LHVVKNYKSSLRIPTSNKHCEALFFYVISGFIPHYKYFFVDTSLPSNISKNQGCDLRDNHNRKEMKAEEEKRSFKRSCCYKCN